MRKSQSRGMFGRILYRSLQRRWQRLVVAGFAMVLGGLLVAALSTLTLDVGSKVGKELRAYGANIVISPHGGVLATGAGELNFGSLGAERYLSSAEMAALDDRSLFPDVAGYVPYLYGVVESGGQPLILAGARLDRIATVSPWWSVDGRWIAPDDGQGAMIGSDVARQLGLVLGATFAVEYQGHRRELTVAGIVETGAAENSQVFVNLPVAQELLGRPGAVALVQVSALTAKRPLAETAKAIERAVPSGQVKIISQIADAEATVFQKIQLLMALVAGLVLIAAALSVASTMTTMVLERTREIGLLKALGAGDKRIAALFLAEAAALGFCGGIVGYALGLLAARLIAQSVFQAPLAPHWVAVPATIGVALLVSLAGSIFPVRQAMAIDPVSTLRGE